MNIFLKEGISLICELENSAQTDLQEHNDAEETGVSEKPIDDNESLKKWRTREGLIEVALDGDGRRRSAKDRWGTKEGIIEVASEETPIEKKTLIERWGTREGIIEVATERAKEQEQLKKILQLRKSQFKAEAALNKKLRRHDIIQIAITNESNKERAITLWGTGIPISPSLPEDIASHQTVSQSVVGVHPQGIIVNPFNSLVYVANQLSDSVSVANSDGAVLRTIKLPQFGYPGTYSPTHLAVHSKVGSAAYGKVYVVGSVANSVSVINTSLEMTQVISVGVRPVAIAFNPVNERIYVANMVGNTISVINTATDAVVETLPTQPGPWQLEINQSNGDIYILYRKTGKVQILNVDHLLVFESNAINEPVSLTWNAEANRMYVISIASDQVIPIDADTHTLLAPIPVGHRPYAIAIHPGNKFIYVANTADGTISIVDSANILRGTIQANGINAGLVVHPRNILFWSKTASQVLEVTGYTPETSAIQTDHNELSSHLNYFRDNPATLQHIRFVVSGNLPIRNLTITHSTISGRKADTAISLSSYESPQHFAKVYEIDKVKGTRLDGNSRWRFALPPLQSVTLLVYYLPHEREIFFKRSLAKKTRKQIC